MEKLRTIFALALLSAVIVIALPMSSVNAQETLIFSADVSSDGTPVTTPVVLEAGRQYRIVAYGVFWSSPPPFWYHADAQYYTTTTWETDYTQPNGHSFLQINEMDVNWGMWSDTPYFHTYTIYYIGEGAPITFRIVDWIDGNYDNNECHFRVYIYEGPPVPVGETAFAYGGEFAWCFLDMDFDGDGKRDFKNWGWSNGRLGPGYYEFDIWAGAAKCNLNKGTLVGTLTIGYDGSTVEVTYLMDEGWTMGFAHLYVDGEPLPRDGKGDFTVAPGQYPYIHYVDGAEHTFTVTGLDDGIYVVAHADVFKV